MPGASLGQSSNTCCGNPYCGYTNAHDAPHTASLKLNTNDIEHAVDTR
jgi:hypothetical protein